MKSPKNQSSVHLESSRTTCSRHQGSWKLKEIPKIWEILQPDYKIIMDLQTMGKVQIKKIKKYFSFKQVVPKVQHLKLMSVAWYSLLI